MKVSVKELITIFKKSYGFDRKFGYRPLRH